MCVYMGGCGWRVTEEVCMCIGPLCGLGATTHPLYPAWWMECTPHTHARAAETRLNIVLMAYIHHTPKTQGVEVGGAATLSRLEHFIAHDEAGFKAGNGGKDAYKVGVGVFVCLVGV